MLLTTKELAKHLGVHPETVRRMVRRGIIPVVTWTGVGCCGLTDKPGFRFDLKKVLKSLEK